MGINIVATAKTGANDLSNNTTPAVNTTGATCFVAFLEGVSGAVLSSNLSDSAGNSGWVDCGAGFVATGSGSGKYVAAYYLKNPTTSASHTFTVSTSFQVPRFVVYAISGEAASPIGAFGSKAVSGTTSMTMNSLTPAVDNSLLLWGVTLDNVANVGSYDSSFVSDNATGSIIGANAAHYQQGTKAAVAPTASWTGSDGAGAIIVAISPAITYVGSSTGATACAGLAAFKASAAGSAAGLGLPASLFNAAGLTSSAGRAASLFNASGATAGDGRALILNVHTFAPAAIRSRVIPLTPNPRFGRVRPL